MNDQHYATPNADLKPQLTDISDLLSPLLSTKPWVRLCSIVGFIFGALSIFGGVGLIAAGSASSSSLGMGMPMGGLGAIYLIFGALYFIPSVFLFKYASAISLAESSNSMVDVTDALKYQKSFWKFAGIVVLLMIVLFVLGIGAAIIIPMIAGM